MSKRYPELSDGLLSIVLWEYRNEIIKQKESKKTGEKNGEGSKIAYQNKYSEMLLESKNIIFRGAAGIGKTYLANQIAADIVSLGRTTKIEQLTSEGKTQIEFVQFHPSYDYTDFVEGLRPFVSDEGIISFTLKPGRFKLFVEKALEV